MFLASNLFSILYPPFLLFVTILFIWAMFGVLRIRKEMISMNRILEKIASRLEPPEPRTWSAECTECHHQFTSLTPETLCPLCASRAAQAA